MTTLSRPNRTRRLSQTACSTLALLAAAPAAICAPAEPTITFAIPAGTMESVLTTYAIQAHVQLLYTPDLVAGRRSAGLTGALTAREALGRLLSGSGLSAQVSRPGVIVLGGQPSLRRYCLFGHLFASGADGEVVRIDRHPTMSRHPVTPMHEADLRRHLAAQGLAPLALLPWTQLEADGDADLLPEGDVLVDAARPEHVARIGRAIAQGPVGEGVLVVGPSSVVEAVVAARPGPGRPATQPARKRAAGPVFVLAGSQSPNTARQVAAATSYQLVHIDAARLADAAPAGYLAELVDTCMAHLSAGRPVLACTMPPPGAAPPATVADPRALAEAGGRLLAAVLARAPLARVGVAGGDTSSHAVLGLDAWGLSFMRRLAPGVSLCRLHSDQPELDGLELMLKGGQMGGDDLFERLLAD